MTPQARFMVAINKHADTVTLDLLFDLAKALGWKLRVELEPKV